MRERERRIKKHLTWWLGSNSDQHVYFLSISHPFTLHIPYPALCVLVPLYDAQKRFPELPYSRRSHGCDRLCVYWSKRVTYSAPWRVRPVLPDTLGRLEEVLRVTVIKVYRSR